MASDNPPPPNQSGAANRRPAGQSDSSGNLLATVAADRAFPAAVAELGRYASQRRNAACLSLLCLVLISVAVTSGCATCGRSSVPPREKKSGDIWSDRSLWGGLLDAFGTH
jgi:hypothetical protein